MLGYETRRAEESGLSPRDVQESRRLHGENRLSRKKGKCFFRRFLSNLNDPVIRILLGALLLNLLLLFRGGNRLETLGIGVAVLLATLISTLSEHNSARAFAALSEEEGLARCRVRRAGEVLEIPAVEVVVGDVLLLSPGERIAADGLLLTGLICTDQSMLTGESREIEKRPSSDPSTSPDSPSSLFRGCTVASGSGEMRVLAVGDATRIGQISREVQDEQRDSPLKLRLSRLARQISHVGYAAALLVSLAYLVNVLLLDSGMRLEILRLKLESPAYLLEHGLRALTLGLTVLVVAVPEGLPMMIAVVLSANSRRMVRDRVLVRKPAGIEAAGSMNLLFTDKTGTLTEGNMRPVAFCLAGERQKSLAEAMRRGLVPALYAALCFRYGNDAVIGRDADGRSVALGGSATERALLGATLDLRGLDGYRVCDRLPFDSARKYSAVRLAGKESLSLLLGAPEVLLPACREEMTAEGRSRPLLRGAWEKELRRETARGGRVLAVALSAERLDAADPAKVLRSPLLLLGTVTLEDPLRPEAFRAVRDLQSAGINVVMITGDSPETAKSIAAQCGILTPSRDLVLTGASLAAYADGQLKSLLPRLAAVARALPSDKSRLVRLAQESGLVVGMTGDGINDAPALRRADIGFSMGSGTQVAKDAGDILILDDNLASIVRAVLYGRTVFKSIRKFITLQLTMNLCAVGVTMIAPFLGVDSPVTVIQMLWINVIMDTLGGLAFAGEAPLPDYMRERPKRRDEPILNRYMINQILLLGGFSVLLFLTFLTCPLITSLFRHTEGDLCHLTAFFGLFIFASVLNCFNTRTDRLSLAAGLGKNRPFLVIMGAILAIQLLFLYLGGSVLRTMPLTARELWITWLLALSVFPADLLRKALLRLRGRRSGY